MPKATDTMLVKLGEGTSYTRHHLDFLSTTATVTEFVDSGVELGKDYVAAGLNGANQVFALGEPKCRSTNVRGLPGGRAIVTKKFGRKGVNLRPVSRVWSGTHTFTSYHTFDSNGQSIESKDKDGNYVPVSHSLRTVGISWEIDEATDPLIRGDIFPLINKVNDAPFYIDSRHFPAGTLRFDGAEVLHLKHGGVDRYRSTFSAMGNEFGWKNQILTSAADAAAGRSKFAMVDMYPRGNFSVLNF